MRRRKTFRKFSSIKVTNKEEVEECMKELHPMALGVMVSETNKIGGSPKTSFEEYIVKSTKALLDKKIESKKWILSINKFVEKKIKEMSAEDPEHNIGEKISLKNLIVLSSSIKQSSYGSYHSVLSINEFGWKYHFSTSKMLTINSGDSFNLSATVKSNAEGITFLSRIKITEYIKKEEQK